jgi:hypothetical protein
VVDDVVRSARRSVIAAQGEKTLSLAGRTGQDQQPRSTVMDDRWSADFLFALDTLCSMPAPAEIADALATHSSLRSRVDQAAGWLQTLATLLRN